MDWSLSKVIRIETGSVGISTNDLKALLNLYRVENEDKHAELVALARAARKRSWRSAYYDVAPPGLLQLIDYEMAATSIRNFETLLVPDLLQTDEYIYAIARNSDERFPNENIEIQLKRQCLLEENNPPQLFFIMDEAVLRRPVGSRSIMQRQLQRIMDVAARPNVTIEVVPFSAGFHPGLKRSFVVLEFPDCSDDDIVYLKDLRDGLTSRDDFIEVQFYRESFETLHTLSLGPKESSAYLGEISLQFA